MTNQEMAAYFRAGGAGRVPRPELTGLDLVALVYYVRRTSLQGELEEIDLAAIKADLGYTGADKAGPTIIFPVANRQDDNTVVVSYSTSEPTISCVVYSTQWAPSYQYGRFTPLEPGYFTGHFFLLHVPLGRELHWQVIAKDAAGNAAVSVDQVFSG